MAEYLGDDRRLVRIYRSTRKEGMYLYVDRQEDLARVPEALRQLFGAPQHAMDLLLTPDRRLARTEAREVLDRIREQGFFLQMPPLLDDEMRAIALANQTLTR